MTLKNTFFVWACASLAAPLAFSAAPKTYCAPLATLTKKLSSCTDNEVLMAEAGVMCLKKFEKAADKQTEEIQKMMKDSLNADGVKSQESLLKGSEANYLEAKRRLELLIADGKRAVAEVDAYSDNLAMPEDFENATQMGFTVEGFLASIPCYNDNKKVLRRVGRDFFQKINDLEQTKATAFSLETKSGTAKVGVGASSSEDVSVKNGTGKSAAPTKGQKPGSGTSDITGTEKKAPAKK